MRPNQVTGHVGDGLASVRTPGTTFWLAGGLCKIVTVIPNTECDVTCRRLSPTRAVSRSSSTRIAEVKNPGTASEHDLPPGDDHGYPWRYDTFWRFEERDGGVYMEVEAVSLTRNAGRAVSPSCPTRGARRAGGEPPYGCRNAPGRIE
jgi:hypothetical protein